MDLEPSADEVQVIDAARDFLSRALPVGRHHDADGGLYTAEMRNAVADLGWFGMGLPEADGGFGFTAVDEMLIYREIGRFLGPVAILGATLAARLASSVGSDRLAEIVSGDISVALAVAQPDRDDHLLLDAHGAELAFVLDADEARLVDLASITLSAIPFLDKSVSAAHADLSGASIVASAPAAPFQRSARLLTAAMLVGIAEAVTDMITEYAKIRETFGRAIGAYQAVRHPIAEMAVKTFAARCQLFLAAVAVRDGQEDSDTQVNAAKATANEAALRNAENNIQLHGGIATTDEHDAHFFMKRANLLVRLFGSRAVLDALITPALAA